MDLIRCMIVDDEPLPLELLEDYIRKTPFLHLAGAFSNPLEALAEATRQPIDLIFLDIQMVELNGLQFTQLLNKKSKVIFTTAYPQYALQGFELDVLDYLLKPVSFDRFLQSVGKARELLQPTGKLIVPATTNAPENTTLLVKSGHKIIQIVIDDILYVEGLREYIAIHTLHGKTIVLQTLRKIEEALPAGRFIRIHKSFLVAFDKIGSIEKGHLYIRDKSIPIGDTYREAFFELLKQKKWL